MRLPLLAVLAAAPGLQAAGTQPEEQQAELDWALGQLPHHRTKRFLFLTEEKRLVMPPGSQLVLTPTLALPFLRQAFLLAIHVPWVLQM
jgi:hypothetical protein